MNANPPRQQLLEWITKCDNQSKQQFGAKKLMVMQKMSQVQKNGVQEYLYSLLRIPVQGIQDLRPDQQSEVRRFEEKQQAQTQQTIQRQESEQKHLSEVLKESQGIESMKLITYLESLHEEEKLLLLRTQATEHTILIEIHETERSITSMMKKYEHLIIHTAKRQNQEMLFKNKKQEKQRAKLKIQYKGEILNIKSPLQMEKIDDKNMFRKDQLHQQHLSQSHTLQKNHLTQNQLFMERRDLQLQQLTDRLITTVKNLKQSQNRRIIEQIQKQIHSIHPKLSSKLPVAPQMHFVQAKIETIEKEKSDNKTKIEQEYAKEKSKLQSLTKQKEEKETAAKKVTFSQFKL